MKKFNSIKISKKTCDELKKIGRKSDSYDLVINELVHHANKCDYFWGARN